MEKQFYDAKEAMQRLNKPTTSFYRDVKEGRIPFVGKRPNMRFPKEAIDALAEVELGEDEQKLTFTYSTIADAWTKQEITQQPYDDEDVVPFKTLLEWRKRNDEISMNVKDGNRIVGWATFLPLDEKIIQALVNDRMREKDIPFQAIKKWPERKLSVYVPIIEVIPSGNIQRDRDRGMFLIRKTVKWAITLTIQHDIKNWYAIGVTPEGQAILEALGFEQINSLDGGKRKGYILESMEKPVKLLSMFIKDLTVKEQLAIPQKIRREALT